MKPEGRGGIVRRKMIVALLFAGSVVAWTGRPAGAVAEPATAEASCLGLGSSFYGTFATQQRAFVAQFVVDTTGHPEMAGFRVLSSTNPAFNEPAKEMIMKSVFRPGRVRGQAVRVQVQQAVSFNP